MTRTLALLVLASASCAGAQMQVNIPGLNIPNPGPNDITVDTNRNTRSVTCKDGGGLFVRGNSNHLQVDGDCTVIHILGNRNVVAVTHAKQLVTEGNGNLVQYKDRATVVHKPGNKNTVSLVE